MTSSYMSITKTVSYKPCARLNSLNLSSDYAKNFWAVSAIHKGSINPRIQLNRLNVNQKTLKHHTRAGKLEPEREEKEEDDDKEDDNDKDEDEDRAEETVLKLYTDIKDRNINGISEVIGDECQCFCNFLSSYRLLQGKRQVMAFFYWLMMKLGKDIKIVVKPTSKDGMTVGVQWQLEWDKPHIQLGKGFSIHICHIYQGKLLIKNVEMFMEPIFHIEHLRLRTMGFAVSLAEKMVTYLRPAGNIRRQATTVLLFALSLLVAVTFYFTQQRF